MSELEMLFQKNKKLEKEDKLVFIETEIPFFEIKEEILDSINKKLELKVIPEQSGNKPFAFIFFDEKGEPVKTTTVVIQSDFIKEDFFTIEKDTLIKKSGFYLLGHMDSYLLGKWDTTEYKDIFEKTLKVILKEKDKIKNLYLQKINMRIVESPRDENKKSFEFLFSFTDGKTK